MCMIFGEMERFTGEELGQMYSSREEYLARVDDSIAHSMQMGFLLPDDAEKIRKASEKMSQKIPQ